MVTVLLACVVGAVVLLRPHGAPEPVAVVDAGTPRAVAAVVPTVIDAGQMVEAVVDAFLCLDIIKTFCEIEIDEGIGHCKPVLGIER